MEIWQILFCLLKSNLRSQFKQLSSLKFDVTQNASKISSYSSPKNKSPHTQNFLEH